MTTAATNSGDGCREFICTSCGVPYDKHPGLTATCAALQTQKTLNAELRRVNAKGATLERLVRFGYEMEFLTAIFCAELLGEDITTFLNRGWVQSRIRDALVEAKACSKGIATVVEQILKDF